MSLRYALSALCLAITASPAWPQEKDAKDESDEVVPFKRRSKLTDEQLRKQLFLVPEVGLDQAAAKLLYDLLKEFKDDNSKTKGLESIPPDLGPLFLARMAASLNRPSHKYLPWRAGQESQLGKEDAERMQVLSAGLRDYLRSATPSKDIRPDAEKLRGLFAEGSGPRPAEWKKVEAIPTLTQMLQVENMEIRLLLVDLLADIKVRAGSVALAERAVFDLSAKVRERAVAALSKRPVQEYQQSLLDGLRWPWPPVADHAAEAIVALKRKDLAPALAALLKEPDPTLPQTAQVKTKRIYFVRELVRMNHMGNCMVCHAPSVAKGDLVRGHAPTPGEDPPPVYYQERSGHFIRADITFLRQAFSVPQPVLNSGKWPGNQRFDYLLRSRPLTSTEFARAIPKEGKAPATYPQRESVLFALRELTGRDAGSRPEAWLELLKAIPKKK